MTVVVRPEDMLVTPANNGTDGLDGAGRRDGICRRRLPHPADRCARAAAAGQDAHLQPPRRRRSVPRWCSAGPTTERPSLSMSTRTVTQRSTFTQRSTDRIFRGGECMSRGVKGSLLAVLVGSTGRQSRCSTGQARPNQQRPRTRVPAQALPAHPRPRAGWSINSCGGLYGESIEAAFIAPFEAETGIEVVYDPNCDDQTTKLAAHAEAGQVQWDVIGGFGGPLYKDLHDQGLLTTIDHEALGDEWTRRRRDTAFRPRLPPRRRGHRLPRQPAPRRCHADGRGLLRPGAYPAHGG